MGFNGVLIKKVKHNEHCWRYFTFNLSTNPISRKVGTSSKIQQTLTVFNSLELLFDKSTKILFSVFNKELNYILEAHFKFDSCHTYSHRGLGGLWLHSEMHPETLLCKEETIHQICTETPKSSLGPSLCQIDPKTADVFCDYGYVHVYVYHRKQRVFNICHMGNLHAKYHWRGDIYLDFRDT